MSIQICKECGKKPADNNRDVCFPCWQRQMDFADFHKHSYTHEELSTIPLGSIIMRILFKGFGKLIIIVILASLGAISGAFALGAAGTGGGIVLGVILGLVIGRGINIMPSEKYEPIVRRLNGAFLAASVVFSFVGLVIGVVLSEKFFLGMGRNRVFVIPLIITLVAGIGATACLLISGPKYKKDAITAFDEWKKKQIR